MLCNKIVPPLQLPWKDVALDPDGSAIARGIPISIGTPPQQLSLRPAIDLNNTFVFQASVCGNLPNASCSAPLGGVFDIFKSSSSVVGNPPEWNGSSSWSENLGFDSPNIYFQDSLRMGPQETLLGFPIVAYTESNRVFQSSLGLGSQSLFLKGVSLSGLSSSSVWSLWTGSRSTENPVDGLLMIGGFDEARVTEALVNFPINLDSGAPPALQVDSGSLATVACPLSVNIASVSYETGNMSFSLFRNPQVPLTACLDSFYNYIELPQNTWNMFAEVSGGTYNSTWQALTYSRTDPPTGSMRITLDNNYVTTIPTDELFVKPRHWNVEGQYATLSDWPLVAEVGNSSFYPGLSLGFGVPFMTMNYLIVDYERNQFQMAPANRTNFLNNDRAQQPTVICRPRTNESATSTASNTIVSTKPLTIHTASPSPSSTASKSEADAIAGSITGVFLGVALIALLGFVILPRYQKRGGQKTRTSQSTKAVQQPAPGPLDNPERIVQNESKILRASTY